MKILCQHKRCAAALVLSALLLAAAGAAALVLSALLLAAAGTTSDTDADALRWSRHGRRRHTPSSSH
jgi:hypothetical protein